MSSIMNSYDRFRYSTPLIIPEKAHPLVKVLLIQMRKQNVRYCDMSKRSGVSVNTIRKWRRGGWPTLINLEACLQVVERSLRSVRLKSES